MSIYKNIHPKLTRLTNSPDIRLGYTLDWRTGGPFRGWGNHLTPLSVQLSWQKTSVRYSAFSTESLVM